MTRERGALFSWYVRYWELYYWLPPDVFGFGWVSFGFFTPPVWGRCVGFCGLESGCGLVLCPFWSSPSDWSSCPCPFFLPAPADFSFLAFFFSFLAFFAFFPFFLALSLFFSPFSTTSLSPPFPRPLKAEPPDFSSAWFIFSVLSLVGLVVCVGWASVCAHTFAMETSANTRERKIAFFMRESIWLKLQIVNAKKGNGHMPL